MPADNYLRLEMSKNMPSWTSSRAIRVTAGPESRVSQTVAANWKPMATSSLWKWIFAAILLTASLSHAQTIKRVPADFPSIQAAIDASANGDTVLVSPGTYRENIDFRGKRITVQSESGPESTIIDGGGSGTVVKFVTREDESTVIRGFTIQNGSQSYEGGGIGVSGSSPKILGNRIINNLGCGISVNFGSPVIQGNTISHNQRTCGVGAGAIYLGGSSSPQVLDNIISDNTGGSTGGAIIDWSADKAVIRNNIIMGNKGSVGWHCPLQRQFKRCDCSKSHHRQFSPPGRRDLVVESSFGFREQHGCGQYQHRRRLRRLRGLLRFQPDNV